jgi:hypothetical protein
MIYHETLTKKETEIKSMRIESCLGHIDLVCAKKKEKYLALGIFRKVYFLRTFSSNCVENDMHLLVLQAVIYDF